MPIPVTRTKVLLPRRRPDLLTRQRLLDALYDLLDYKLIVIAAPAGYGKTSLLVDFAHQANLPVCWYALDLFDRDPQRFVAHFIAAISQRFPSFGHRSEAALNASNPANLDTVELVSTIVNEAYEHVQEHFLLVLDDYHLVNEEKKVQEFVSRFVQEVDENCHLILSSRALLNLPDMPLMVARSQVGGLSFEELAFQACEIQALVLKNYHLQLPAEAAEELARETEGWVTGLLLSAHSMWQGMADRLRVARVSRVGLYDYLAQQVLDQQPSEVREFLMQSSFLEELDAELCQAVFGAGKDWERLIGAVLQNNLFVLPVGEEGRWIRYHHLFRDFLQAQLEREQPLQREEILRRLGAVYAAQGEWEKAYASLRCLGDVRATADLVEQAGRALVKSGRMVTLAQWIDSLPAEVLAGRPNLLSLRGVAATVLGNSEQGLALLNRAEAAQRASGDWQNLARTLVRRSVAHRFLGDYSSALADADEARGLAGREEGLRAVQAEALRATGTSLYQVGRLHEAIDKFSQSLSLYSGLGDRQMEAMVRMELGMASMSAGRYAQSLSYYQQALAYWREVKNTSGQANLLNNLGVLHYLRGEYERAGSVFEEALTCARQAGYARMEAYVLCSIGDLYADLEAGEAAQQAYQQSWEIARKLNYRFLMLYAELALAALALRRGAVEAARQRLASARRLAEGGGSSYETALWQLACGQLDLVEGRPAQAAAHFQQAALRFDAGGQQVEAARAHLFHAIARHAAGNGQPALSELGLAFQRVSSLDSQHALVVAGWEAGELAGPLLKAAQKDALLGRPASRLVEQVRQFEKELPSLRRRLRPRTSAIPFAPPKLTIHALGRAQVELDGRPVTAAEWQNQKRVRELLFFLLANPEGLTKEAIGLVIWPESSAAQLKLQFKNAIYRLRYALGQNVISFDGERYWFNREQDYEYDVESFLAALERARKVRAAREKVAAYQAALELYRGDYLPEVGGSWAVPIREQLWQKHVEAVLALSRLQLEAGEAGAALELALSVLAGDSCQEEAHRLAMLAYAARGDQAGVARQFERCRRALWEELQAQPSPQTTQLYETLRR